VGLVISGVAAVAVVKFATASRLEANARVESGAGPEIGLEDPTARIRRINFHRACATKSSWVASTTL